MQGAWERIRLTRACYERILAEGDCLQLSDLAVSGDDLIAMGMKPGKEIGRILHMLLETVLEEPLLNERELLLLLAMQLQ